MKRFGAARRLIACCLLVLALDATSGARADHTIYSTHVERLLKLRKDQRKRVRQILNQSERSLMAVFAKYGIDPYAKPDFNKLVGASGPLQAVGRRERRLLKQILTPAQLKIYDRAVEHTSARVIKATRTRD
ncbi:MAG: hypothetical protein ACR2PM_10955 [Hyphomicrobiales bacterium]